MVVFNASAHWWISEMETSVPLPPHLGPFIMVWPWMVIGVGEMHALTPVVRHPFVSPWQDVLLEPALATANTLENSHLQELNNPRNERHKRVDFIFAVRLVAEELLVYRGVRTFLLRVCSHAVTRRSLLLLCLLKKNCLCNPIFLCLHHRIQQLE